MNISIVDSASVALSYDRLVREFLAERARSRHEIAGPNFFGEFLSVGNPALKLRALAEHPRATAPPKDNLTKEQLKQKKDSEAAAKAASAAANSSPRREKQPWRQDKNRDNRDARRSRSRSLSRRNRPPSGRLPPRRSQWELSGNPACFRGEGLFDVFTWAFRFLMKSGCSPPRTPPAVEDEYPNVGFPKENISSLVFS